MKYLIVGITTLLATLNCAAENSSDGFVAETLSGDVLVEVIVHTVEGQSKRVDTWWSGKVENRGSANTNGDDFVIWGYFYVDETQTNWGNPDNPDIYLKLWRDRSGRIDVNFFHISVPDITVSAALADGNGDEIRGTKATAKATLQNRFVQLRLEPDSSRFIVSK